MTYQCNDISQVGPREKTGNLEKCLEDGQYRSMKVVWESRKNVVIKL